MSFYKTPNDLINKLSHILPGCLILLKIVQVLSRCDMPLKNSSIISNFIIIKEIKNWKNRAIHISIPQASVVEIATVVVSMHGWFIF